MLKIFLPFSALMSLYTSIIEPHFRYYCSVWGCAGTTKIIRLQKLQNRAARIATNISFDAPSNQLIEKLGWKTINELIDIESKTMIFKSLNELALPYLCSLFSKNSLWTTQSINRSLIAKNRYRKRKTFFSFRGVKLSLSTFKQCIL